MVDFKKWSLAFLCVVAILVAASCSDSTVKKVAQTEAGINAACATTFQIVAAAAATTPPLISQTDANSIIQLLVQVEQGNRQAETATEQIANLSATDAKNIMATLTPVETAIDNAIQNGTVNIKDPATKSKVQAALVAIQALVNTALTLLKGAS